MLICEICHKARMQRKAPESQSLQWTGYQTKINHACPECGQRQRTTAYEYMNAYELACELGEAKEKLEKLQTVPSFPVNLYIDAGDMLQSRVLSNIKAVDSETFDAVLQYTAELEAILCS